MNVPYLSLVIPVYNEALTLPELISRCLEVCTSLSHPFEIILVDDGSRDRSGEIIRIAAHDNGDRVIGLILNRNYGQHAAVMAGMAESSGKVVVTLDADLQNPPEEIPKLLVHVDAGCDVVGSVRLMRRDSLFRRFGSCVVNKAVQRATGVIMRDYGCMLRAYRRPVVDAMLRCGERSTFIPVLANSFAGRTAEVEVRHAERGGGRSRYGFLKLMNLQFDLLTCMTTFPLRILSFLGIGMAGVGFLAGLFLFLTRVIYGAQWAAEGVFTILAVLFFLVGAQLLGMGLVGEYIGRIYTDVRARPRYFVRERIKRVNPDAEDPCAAENYRGAEWLSRGEVVKCEP